MAKEILIADSEKTYQEEFSKIFRNTDYQFVFSENGEDALLRVRLFKPDLIIAAKNLKKKSGLELCETIKMDPEFKHIPFILLLSIFEEISERDRQRLQADGVISKPLHGDEIINMVDYLMGEKSLSVKEEKVSGSEWDFLGKKDEFALGEPGKIEEEEIIELVDVIEEPEQKMGIDHFVAPEKEEPLGEITPLESWGKLEEEEKPLEKEWIVSSEEKEGEKTEIPLWLEKETAPQEALPEVEIFGKIETEGLAEEVKQPKPSIEEEWLLEKEVKASEEVPSITEEPSEKYLGFEEFEAALKQGVGGEPLEEEIKPFSIEAQKEEVQFESIPVEITAAEEALEELQEEELPEEFLEELEEEEIVALEKPEEKRIEIFEGVMAPEVPGEEIRLVEEPKEIAHEEIKAIETLMITEELKVVEAPIISEERIGPLGITVDKQMEEIIAKGIREMMEGFMTKFIPEMTQSIIRLTLERIEKMVEEIIPDLAEKAIQKEMNRLQKGEKD